MADEGTYYEYQAPTQCYAGEHTTNFAGAKNMDQMKAMLANADHVEVESCAQGWLQVHDQLVTGSGSAKFVFDAAVEHITQHWDGAAAEGFREQAKIISKMITDCSTYAKYTSQAMTNAASVLKTIKPQVDAMEKPGTLSSWGDALGDGFDRSDAQLHTDLGNGMDTQSALDRNRGSLSAGKEAQLEMAVKMEQLGAGYNAQSRAMGSWTKKPMPKGRVNDSDDYPGDPGGVAPVPVVVPPEITQPNTGASSRPTRRTSTGTVSPTVREVKPPRESGISGGVQKPPAGTKPQVGTAIDGIGGGTTGAGGYGGGSAGIGGGVGGVGGPGAGGTAGVGGAGAGLPGALGGVGGRGGRATGSGAGGAGRAGAVGRGGMPGAGGAGAGAGGRGGATAGRGGSLARRGGGVVGAAKGTGSGTRGTPGGSGLHKSRGASGAGSGNTGKGANRMMGRGSTDRTEEEERREGERPDYLVEDEETWTPERNNAPRVIE
ncbi:hypothetical protein ACIP98_36125 [Streptomyces sp. NPDC088354]|uniref:hypothetical protein n=1 Tax=Streptomyces sp. NPDC088354 TaxID=3365856 RepID=UPI003807D85F